MDWRAACAAIIPCFNEGPSVRSVVSGVLRHVQTVIVVDDGSTDETAGLARQAGAQVLRQPRNLGKGAALQAGWNRARDLGFPWVLTLDGDGQHSADDIPLFFACAQQAGADLVVGNRMTRPSQMPWMRRLVNEWMSRQLSKVAQRSLPDSQCGFRLINLQALLSLPITTTHFEIESEVLLAFARAGHRIEFVPIQVLYKNEQSKIHPVRDTLRWFRWWRLARVAARQDPRRKLARYKN